MIDAEVTWCGGGLQSRLQWVRIPPASFDTARGQESDGSNADPLW